MDKVRIHLEQIFKISHMSSILIHLKKSQIRQLAGSKIQHKTSLNNDTHEEQR